MSQQNHAPYDQVFITRLDLWSSLYVMARRRLRNARQIYCRHASPVARRFWKGRIRVIPDHTYTKVGDGYFVLAQFEMITMLVTRFFQEPDEYLRRFFELRMAEDLGPALALVLDHQIMSGSLAGTTCLVVPATPFLDVVCRHFATGTLAIEACWSLAGLRRAYSILGVTGLKIARAALQVLRPGRERLAPRPPSISVFGHRGGIALDLRTDVFWLDPERDYPNVLVEVAKTRFARFSPRIIEELGRKKIRVVETHGARRLYPDSLYWRPGGRFIRGVLHSAAALVVALARERGEAFGLRWWKAINALRYWLIVHERLEYYRAFNIKAELRIGLGGTEEPAHSSALNECGGISCTAQYSMTYFYATYTSTSTIHLYFGHACLNPRMPLRARFNVVNGYTYKTSLLRGESIVADLKRRLREAGVTRSAGFFEERPYREFRVRYLYPAYRFLIRRVLDDSRFGLIIKPKKTWVGPELLREEIGPEFDEAMKTGRVIILGWEYFPGVVSRAVDLTLGLLCTATLEAALLGRPTLHLNTRNFIQPFFRPAAEHIFDNVADFTQAVTEFFARPERSTIGIHSEAFIRAMDHYDDAEASARIEYLVTRYTAEVAKGKDPESALHHTIHGFRERWGWHAFGSDAVPELVRSATVGACA